MLLNLILLAAMTLPLKADLNATLDRFAAAAMDYPQSADPARLAELNALADWIAEQPLDTPTELIFICTHNSRRSHMGQIWGQAAAWHNGLDDVRTFSGGTEATAFNPRAVSALRDLGVGIHAPDPSAANPPYQVHLQPERPATTAWSKVYSAPENPQRGFAAIMTCSDADEACPLVFGSAARFALPYVDPKVSDGTAAESATYREHAEQIGIEMFYVMSRAASKRNG